MPSMTAPRYALYWLPPTDSALGAFGRRWFSDCGPPMAGFSRERQALLTETCRQYRFHATLKAPFRLSRQTSATELRAALEAFARQQPPVPVPPLHLRMIGDFLALAPRGPAPAIGRFAGSCVRTFDRFRAPLTYAELARRRAAGLRPQQAALLARWGYPYVMERFRFHLTLTDPIRAEAERAALATRLLPLVAPLARMALTIEDVCLVRQDEAGGLFVIDQRFCLTAPGTPGGYRDGRLHGG